MVVLGVVVDMVVLVVVVGDMVVQVVVVVADAVDKVVVVLDVVAVAITTTFLVFLSLLALPYGIFFFTSLLLKTYPHWLGMYTDKI